MILAVAPSSYLSRMDKIANAEDGSAQGRINAWKAGIWMAIYNPVLGAGAGNFTVHWGKTAHSIYFLTLGELGLSGVALLLLHRVEPLREPAAAAGGRGPRPSDDGDGPALLATMSARLLAFAVAGAFLSATYYPHMYVLAGLHTAARRSSASTWRSRARRPQCRRRAKCRCTGPFRGDRLGPARPERNDHASGDRKTNLLIVASSLWIGGAETVIRHLAQTIDRSRFNVTVVCLKQRGTIGDELRQRPASR